MKNLCNLTSVLLLSRKELRNINGGSHQPEIDCEMSGGRWTCVGLGNCGCVYPPIDPPEIR